MTDFRPTHAPFQQQDVTRGAPDNDIVLPLIGWGTYVFGWGLIGLVIAYIDRGNTAPPVRENYTYMIRTFWIGLAYVLLAFVVAGVGVALAGAKQGGGLALAGFGFWLLPVLVAIWFIARCVKGVVLLVRRQPFANPRTWLI